ncbi:S6e family ribosomal protein [[Eubacterium] cellulosolvens]
MAKFKIVVSDPSGKSQSLELEGAKAHPLIGRTLNEVIDGGLLGISGKKVKITGGTDKDGVPMRVDIQGGGKKSVILSSGPGFKPRRSGERRRKMVRGKIITEDTYLLNMRILEVEKKGKEAKPIETQSTQ